MYYMGTRLVGCLLFAPPSCVLSPADPVVQGPFWQTFGLRTSATTPGPIRRIGSSLLAPLELSAIITIVQGPALAKLRVITDYSVQAESIEPDPLAG